MFLSPAGPAKSDRGIQQNNNNVANLTLTLSLLVFITHHAQYNDDLIRIETLARSDK